ncbi:alpha/beta fold hydrolase [Thioclava atlantica]|uniref:Alpha/beta fold family hydrolase n=1 Tax=Thioclava atlantica TaxID=1317124 RepID=A0A085TZA6_9RHOB|nr:alpha/beta fold hydrolase [Thioclava atlantica]KFE36053.1 alpha/beta fold family hydrolase [Thioclava atlantica]
MLNTVSYPADTDALPLLIAPGLFGSARNWNVIAKNLSKERSVVTLDLRNHGDSFWHDDHSYAAMAADIAEVIEANGGKADVLGHSMGGKASMVLALTRPDLVRRLIVADMAPKPYQHGENHGALIDAMREMKIDDLTTRSQADERLAERIVDPGTRAFLLQSLALRDGPVRWKFNLGALKANLPGILDWPDQPERTQFDGPALFLSGAQSHYVRPEDHPRIRALFPQAQFVEVENAGHWLHAERPREVEAEVARFLS